MFPKQLFLQNLFIFLILVHECNIHDVSHENLNDHSHFNIGTKNLQERIQVTPEELQQSLKLEAAPEAIKLVPDAEPVTASPSDNYSIVKRAEEIIYSGVDNIKEVINKQGIIKPSEAAWIDFNNNIKDLFASHPKISELKQAENQNQFVQFIQSGWQNISNAFLQNVNQNNGNKTEDEQTQQGGGGGDFLVQLQDSK